MFNVGDLIEFDINAKRNKKDGLAIGNEIVNKYLNRIFIVLEVFSGGENGLRIIIADPLTLARMGVDSMPWHFANRFKLYKPNA